ncbi:MAG: hypothetical protein ABSD28_18310 [Tepidisphaeraceae bacterium]|jgi:hypothetical protein
MLKSTLVWAVAALLAVPAVPMFATTTTHHRLVAPALTHRAVAKVSKRHHLAGATHRRATSLTHRKLSVHRLTATRHVVRKTTVGHAAVRHTAISSTPHFRVHVTKMPPTIDGIQA